MGVDPRAVDFLRHQAGAHAVPHGERSLFDHLCGTAAILQDWGASPPICAAGLFHSIYGTSLFPHRTLLTDRRLQVRSVIGEEAEGLAFLFCALRRPEGLVENLGRADIDLPLRDGQLHRVPRSVYDSLVEIELANLLDQRMFGKTFKSLLAHSLRTEIRRVIEAATTAEQRRLRPD